jgi:hypothetical protein
MSFHFLLLFKKNCEKMFIILSLSLSLFNILILLGASTTQFNKQQLPSTIDENCATNNNTTGNGDIPQSQHAPPLQVNIFIRYKFNQYS